MTPNQIILALLIAVISISCATFDVPSKYDNLDIGSCHRDQTWDINKTKEVIIGEWEWKYLKCCVEPSDPTDANQNSSEAYKGLIVKFMNDGTGTLIDNDSISDFVWDIDIKDSDLFGFETTPIVSILAGRLFFCDNIMLCQNSYIDGVDNFFEKVK